MKSRQARSHITGVYTEMEFDANQEYNKRVYLHAPDGNKVTYVYDKGSDRIIRGSSDGESQTAD